MFMSPSATGMLKKGSPAENRRIRNGSTGHFGRKTAGSKARSLEKLLIVHAYELDKYNHRQSNDSKRSSCNLSFSNTKFWLTIYF